MKTAKRINDILADVLKQTAKQHSTLFKIQNEWKDLVGKQLAMHTKPVSLRCGRLVVCTDKPGDSFTLKYARAKLLERLQTDTQGKVEDIVIRVSDSPFK